MTDQKTIVKVAMSGDGVIGRRGFLRGLGLGAAGLVGLSFSDLMAVHADEVRKRQMACIVLWMTGGPSQMETFDPKPDHKNGRDTPVIETAVSGIRIAKGWEKTASVMNDLALVRSMTSKEGNHQRATYQMHTGYLPTGTVKHPGFGSIAAAELGDPSFDLPHIVSIGGTSVGAGLLGVAYEPFNIANPSQPPTNAVPRVDSNRFGRRMDLLSTLESSGFARTGGVDRVKEHQALYNQTRGMVLSPRMKAFDLEGEDSVLRDAYGRNPFGQGCLLARRLVETGVTFVEVRSGGWDMHDDLTTRMERNAGQVDPALATLISDLKSKGMLDRTLVVWMGEFGRTPKPNPRGGRDHFPRAFNIAMAGAGVKGGQVIGASSADGTEVKDRPVAVNDLLQTFCHALKIDPAKENMSSVGRPIKIVDGGSPVKELFA